ncbi:MAG: glycosyltransferase [Leptolyngbya sp.]|nr:glycosyltransferase [Leptolyngbya sp.]
MPQVSVIIPSYNAIAHLPMAVQSVLHQTFTDYELIIVNDGSTDGTDQWLRPLSDPRIRPLWQPNQGKSAARNAGIQAARSPLIAFLDADDLWEPTKLEQQVAYLAAHPEVDVVYTWTALADANGHPTGRLIAHRAEGDVWPDLMRANILTCGSTPLIRADCFQQVGLFAPDLPFAQDWEMWIRLAARFQFGVVPAPLVRYRQHAHNTSRDWRRMQACNTQVLERAFQAPPPQHRASVPQLQSTAFHTLYLYLGWLALRSRDYRDARCLWRQACEVVPGKRYTPESVRLWLAIGVERSLGRRRYGAVLSVWHRLRQSLIPQGIHWRTLFLPRGAGQQQPQGVGGQGSGRGPERKATVAGRS